MMAHWRVRERGEVWGRRGHRISSITNINIVNPTSHFKWLKNYSMQFRTAIGTLLPEIDIFLIESIESALVEGDESFILAPINRQSDYS